MHPITWPPKPMPWSNIMNCNDIHRRFVDYDSRVGEDALIEEKYLLE